LTADRPAAPASTAGGLTPEQIAEIETIGASKLDWTHEWVIKDDDMASCAEIKKMKEEGELDADEVEMFEAVPGWTWETTSREHMVIIKKINEYFEKHGRLPDSQ
jgi:hypothetical protein